MFNKRSIKKAISVSLIALLGLNWAHAESDFSSSKDNQENQFYVKGAYNGAYIQSNSITDAKKDAATPVLKSANGAVSGTVSADAYDASSAYNMGLLGGSFAFGISSEGGLGFEIEGIYSDFGAASGTSSTNQYFYYLHDTKEGKIISDSDIEAAAERVRGIYTAAGTTSNVNGITTVSTLLATPTNPSAVPITSGTDADAFELTIAAGNPQTPQKAIGPMENIGDDATTGKKITLSLNKPGTKLVIDDPSLLNAKVSEEINKLNGANAKLIAKNGVKIPVKYENKGVKYAALLGNIYYMLPVHDDVKAYAGFGAGMASVTHKGYNDSEVNSAPLAVQGKVGAMFNLGKFSPYIGYRLLYLFGSDSSSEMKSMRKEVKIGGAAEAVGVADAKIKIKGHDGLSSAANDANAFDDVEDSFALAEYSNKIKSSLFAHNLEVGVMLPFSM